MLVWGGYLNSAKHGHSTLTGWQVAMTTPHFRVKAIGCRLTGLGFGALDYAPGGDSPRCSPAGGASGCVLQAQEPVSFCCEGSQLTQVTTITDIQQVVLPEW